MVQVQHTHNVRHQTFEHQAYVQHAHHHPQPQPHPHPHAQYGQEPVAASAPRISVVNMIGAATSLALVLGVAVWGYKAITRDLSGVPVVQAAEGPMRVQPENPGGTQADHQGLAVNEVAAAGVAAKPADRMILAPAPVDLTLDDVPAQPVASQQIAQAGETSSVEAADVPVETLDPVQLTAVEQLASQLTQDTQPISQEQALPETPVITGGLGRSLRPKLRPSSIGQGGTQVASVSSAVDVDPATIPVGTRLAQLGAFASPEIAQQEWDKLAAKFGDYLEGKGRLIQKAQSGGRTFYRLRATGFSDLSDARRFCSALVAERADCIPVVTR